jgi:hypothetical protein
MKQWRERVKQRFRSKRGASTVEYIIIIAVGALFAGLLLAAINSPDIQQSLQEEVEEVLTGTPSNHDIEKPPLPTLPQISMGDQTKPPSFSDVQPMNPPAKKEPSFLDRLKQKTMDGINWAGNKIDQGLNWLDQQKDQIVNDDFNRAINEPGAYFSEVFGLEDYKAAWDKLTSDPLGYAKDSWNNLKASVNEIIEDPFTLIFDKDMFMEAWNGKDKNGKSIPLPNRLWNMVESLPTPVKLVKVGRIAKDTLVPDSCHCAMKNPKKDKEDDKDKENDKKDSGTVTTKFKTEKPKYDVPDRNFTIKDGKDKQNRDVKYAVLPDGQEVKLLGSQHAGGKNDKGIPFDKDGFVDFSEYVKAEAYLKPEQLKGGSQTQTGQATQILRDHLNANPKLKKEFLEQFPEDERDLIEEHLEKGHYKIGNYTWHHHQETGRMQLIPSDIHNKGKPHTGGHRIWGK